MGREEIAGSRGASLRSVVCFANDTPPWLVRPPGGAPAGIGAAGRRAGHDHRQPDRAEALDRGGYRDCTAAREQYPGGIAARNAAYHRYSTFANNRPNSRALPQERLFERRLSYTPINYQQRSGSSDGRGAARPHETIVPITIFFVDVNTRNHARPVNTAYVLIGVGLTRSPARPSSDGFPARPR